MHSKGHSISELCRVANISRQAHYNYLKKEPSERKRTNELIADTIAGIYLEVKGIYGYRMMQLVVNRRLQATYNLKRIYRLMRLMGLKSVTRKKRRQYKKSSPGHVAENLLNRKFTALRKNQKWLTDVTEFKYGDGQKAYLSAILDLYDNSIVAYVIGKRNNNKLVFSTLQAALKANPEAQPLIHSDRGFQYTSYGFAKIITNQGMIQSMSRVSRCIDNGPMEGFWGKLKAERYNLRKYYESYEDLVADVSDYIRFYNEERPQRKFSGLTPMEYRMCA
ncbi:MAG: IS3 family transposase [Bacillota bacterium]